MSIRNGQCFVVFVLLASSAVLAVGDSNDNTNGELRKLPLVHQEGDWGLPDGMTWSDALRVIERSYRSLISIETHKKHDPKKRNLVIEGYPDRMAWQIREMEITKVTTLEEALNRYCVATDDSFERQTIGGQLCLLPIDVTGDRLTTELDRPISISLKNVTAEVGVAAVVKAYNLRYPDDKIVSGTNAEQFLWKMPSSYYDVAQITVEADELSTRHVLCAVLNQAPLQLGYVFHDKLKQVLIVANYKSPQPKPDLDE